MCFAKLTREDMFIRSALLLLIVVLLYTPGCTAQPADEARPRNVILFVADGCGPASFTYARDFLRYRGRDGLALDGILVGAIHTYAADSRVTDSAAGATAFACGVKTYNGAIAVDTLRRPVATLLEAAEARGMATGLVATSTITHATPASFSAHVPDRGEETAIAEQQLEHDIDVMFGGGAGFFLPQAEEGWRSDGRNLLAEAAADGYQVLRTRADFDAPLQMPVLGLFSRGHMAYEIDRDAQQQPSLAEMTARAIDLLSDDPDGFFLMVEGSRIDHAGHANDAAGHLHDILAFDEAVAAALAFAREDGETLIVSTSDHETGGLTLGRNVDGRSMYGWNPEVVERVRHSNEHLGTFLGEGADWAQVLRENLGVEDMTDAEREAAGKAFTARNEGAFFRALNEMVARRAFLGWTTGGHTAVDVNLYAFGPGRDRFIGHHDNTAVGLLIADLMDFDLKAVTETLQRQAVE